MCTSIEQPHGEEKISLLEADVIRFQQCLEWVDELDERLLAQQELRQRCELAALRLQMA